MCSIFSSHIILTADQPGSKGWPVSPFSSSHLTENALGTSAPLALTASPRLPPAPQPEPSQANTTPPSSPFLDLFNRSLPPVAHFGPPGPPLQFPRSYRSPALQEEFLWQPRLDPIFSGYISKPRVS